MKFGIFLVFLLLGLFIANPLCAQTLNEIFAKEDTLVYMGYIQELFNLNDSRNLILQISTSQREISKRENYPMIYEGAVSVF